ncbi:MAG: metal ABC transporter ATP-binding protein [Endomicrobiia bacterium]|nr:metal ABC transporter ATP-binding protein [Endomicrobiaceae bacterium]MDD3054042.1 metal ABC transporter ATP-binding protein [Endomicrobiaceae bacterium]MDD3923056.1 metal ABC transporter ATP-binding protein [Endomicrobiaceae bacterium]
MPSTIIEAKNLSVKYGEIEALSKVSFKIDSGDYVGIVGPNGSGKSTLIKSILGLIPFEGEILFHGESLSEFMLKKNVGYLPQKMSFIDQRFPATAIEIVVSGLYCQKKFPKRITGDDYSSAKKIMQTLAISDLATRSIGKLSGGQQQRILLARALIVSPQILILDEPTVALDPQSRETFSLTVQKLNRELGVTVLLVSHDAGSMGKYASKLLYLDGKIIFYGTFEDFCKSPQMTNYFGDNQHIICHRH